MTDDATIDAKINDMAIRVGPVPDVSGFKALIKKDCKRPFYDPARKTWICFCTVMGWVADRWTPAEVWHKWLHSPAVRAFETG
jgi:hypothetical protein